MLTRSFCCFRGLSEAAERKLWLAGCLDWAMLAYAEGALSRKKLSSLLDQRLEMRAALSGGLAAFFLARLPCGHRLRVWPDFQPQTMFLDIETSGLEKDAEITIIGAWQAGQFMQFVKGQNLHEFLAFVGRTKLLVTFNGIRFDWPVIERQFGTAIPIPHIDLMHEARAYGYRGGLKAIELSIGIHRTPNEVGDGMQAVQLWREYKDSGDRSSLERLLCYNRCDVKSLIVLAKSLLAKSISNYPGPIDPLYCSLTT